MATPEQIQYCKKKFQEKFGHFDKVDEYFDEYFEITNRYDPNTLDFLYDHDFWALMNKNKCPPELVCYLLLNYDPNATFKDGIEDSFRLLNEFFQGKKTVGSRLMFVAGQFESFNFTGFSSVNFFLPFRITTE